jgi:hypothetical protein
MASSTLIAECLEKVAGASLSPWQISALHLDTAAAADLLCACINQQILVPGIIIGKDLAFWAQALRFAGALVAKQQFLPGIRVIERAYVARWQPVLAGGDAQRRKTLIKVMPQVCRALSRQTDAPPATVASSLLDHFLEEMVDHLVRSSMPASPGARPRTFESLHDQWLFALRSPGGEMTGGDSELAALAEQVNEWRRPVEASADAPFRLCFRLEEPKADAEVVGKRRRGRPDDSWYVRYLLQAVDDPSLLVPVASVWSARGRSSALPKRGTFNAQHYLLSALGRTARISPHIEASLRTAKPGGYELDTADAHAFLTEEAWLLEQAGFNVLLPASLPAPKSVLRRCRAATVCRSMRWCGSIGKSRSARTGSRPPSLKRSPG